MFSVFEAPHPDPPEGPVDEFSSFANFEERKSKSNLLMPFPKIVHQKGSFGQIRKNPLFRFCRPILDIFGLTFLSFKFKEIFSPYFLERGNLAIDNEL